MTKRDTPQSIRIEGGLFPNSMLDTVRSGKANRTTDADYFVPKGLRLRDEIARAFRMALPMWQEFNILRNRTDRSESDQISVWHEPLFSRILGFSDLEKVSKCQVSDRSFPLTRVACNGLLPVEFIGAAIEFDKSDARFGTDGRRRSPSGLMQEYLNAMDNALYGIICNGSQIRLYRDNHSLTRPAWLEIDLALMFSEELYADFALMYQLLHQSRLLPGENGAESCILELWREAAHGTGERAVENLRIGVTAALSELGNGFLAHPDNSALRSAIESQKIDIRTYQLQLLRFIYRIIFLSTAEDRELLLDPASPQENQKRYIDGYSIAVLREKAQKRLRRDDYCDCWQQITLVFSALAKGETALALPALGGLFGTDQCPDLDTSSITNRSLLKALYSLSFFKQGNTLARINYRDMDSEELGSVYESLLELVPQIEFDSRPWRFSYAGTTDESRGNARKLSGSYYTPDSLVKELIKSALEPVIKKTFDEHPADPKAALLILKVIDPACGSGHFLLAASRRIAVELACIEATPDQPTEKQYRHALREVISHCIYGVDLNPMAIELARTALWLEALEPGKPLSFLDAHIRCGNALVGVLDPEVVDRGIPDEAFKPLSGDDKEVCANLKKKNKSFAGQIRSECAEEIEKTLSKLGTLPETFKNTLSKVQYHVQESLFSGDSEEDELPSLDDFNTMGEETLAEIEIKKSRWLEYQNSKAYQSLGLKQDIIIAPFYMAKTRLTEDQVPTNADYILLLTNQSIAKIKERNVRITSETYRFFHWHLEFPEVFKKGGFDCVLGNPPWERIKLQEEEFFASRSPLVAAAKNKAERAQRISWLAEGMLAKNCYPSRDHAPVISDVEKMIYQEFNNARREAEAASLFVHIGEDEGGRFPFTGVGDVNLYALFAELFSKIVNESGRAGVIVPSGIATDDSTKAFFAYVSQNEKLVSLIDFENREKLFKAVDSRMKFCLVTLGKSKEARFSFFLTNTSQMQDSRRQFTLSGADIALLNPNTRTCPIFRSQYDAELTKKIYRAAPVLIDENKPEGNPWGIKFSTMFHMSNDSHLFMSREKLEEMGGTLTGSVFTVGADTYLPLYEAKMVHQYDHRWATYEANGEDARDMTIAEKQNPESTAQPRYWVHRIHIDDALQAKNWQKKWLLGWRDVTNATNERTVIGSIIPAVAVNHKYQLFLLGLNCLNNVALFQANITSIVFDYIARQKIGGTSLSYFTMKQLPVLTLHKYNLQNITFIKCRVLQLTYTTHDLAPFAQDLGYNGDPFPFDPDRRAILRAELDAYYARLYGLNRDELRYILDPSDLLGDDYPSETFRVLKDKEMREFGEYRTRRLVLEAWDRLERGELK